MLCGRATAEGCLETLSWLCRDLWSSPLVPVTVGHTEVKSLTEGRTLTLCSQHSEKNHNDCHFEKLNACVSWKPRMCGGRQKWSGRNSRVQPFTACPQWSLKGLVVTSVLNLHTPAVERFAVAKEDRQCHFLPVFSKFAQEQLRIPFPLQDAVPSEVVLLTTWPVEKKLTLTVTEKRSLEAK